MSKQDNHSIEELFDNYTNLRKANLDKDPIPFTMIDTLTPNVKPYKHYSGKTMPISIPYIDALKITGVY